MSDFTALIAQIMDGTYTPDQVERIRQACVDRRQYEARALAAELRDRLRGQWKMSPGSLARA